MPPSATVSSADDGAITVGTQISETPFAGSVALSAKTGAPPPPPRPPPSLSLCDVHRVATSPIGVSIEAAAHDRFTPSAGAGGLMTMLRQEREPSARPMPA